MATTTTVTKETNLVDLENLTSTKQMRAYKQSVIEPKGVEFNKQQTEYQLFPEEYFTGSDLYVYFNDVWIDELTGLSFRLQELVEPQFGYASNTWDYVARGRRLVEGQFRMAFKEAGYMFVILDHIGKLGNTKKTAISWLLNDSERDFTGTKYRGIDGVPDGYADVLERIETALTRIYGDPTAKVKGTSYTEDYRWEFDWDVPLTLGSPNTKMKEKRTSTNQTGQVKQLQQRLIDLGWGFKPWNTAITKGWGMYYAKDNVQGKITDKHLTYWNANDKNGKRGLKSGDWYCGVRFWMESKDGHTKYKSIVSSNNGKSNFEYAMQVRLNSYPGKNAVLNMGSPNKPQNFDGKYGPGMRLGLQEFQKLAGITDGSEGMYVLKNTFKALKAGLEVNGKYDVATRVAVWLFQESQIKGKNTYKIKKANGIVDKQTKAALAEDATRTVKTPGENRYQPDELAESLFAVYEKEVWGRPFVDRAEDVRDQESFFYRSRRSDEYGVHLESLYQEGFDIYINYGPFPQYVQSNNNRIDNGGSFNTTVKAIRNIQIHDVEQILDAETGKPIEEVYYFTAKDLD